MTCATLAFPEAVAFDGRVVALRDCRRVIFGGVVIGLGTMAVACATVTLVTVAAAWIVATLVSANPYMHAGASMGPLALRLNYGYPVLAGASDVAASAPLSADHGQTHSTLDAEANPPHTPAFAPASAAPPLPRRFGERAADWLFSPHPLAPNPGPMTHEIAPTARSTVEAAPAAPANSTPASQATAPTAPSSEPVKRKQAAPQVEASPPPSPQKPPPAQQGHRDSVSLPGPDGHTAIYDIAAHTVYLPDGDRLEAHSGLGKRLDDPRYVNEKNRGPTPPNVYDLALRGELFHGVRAIRLNPVGEGNMFGRDGILAHTYMLGPSGQSFGCVSFRDYHAFLQAFLEGEVNRLVVVPRLRATVSRATLSRHGHPDRSTFEHG